MSVGGREDSATGERELRPRGGYSFPPAQVQEHHCLENRIGSGNRERERHWILPWGRRPGLRCTSQQLKELL